MNKFRFAAIAVLIFLISPKVFSQQWNTFGNFANPGDFVGTTNNAPLEFRQFNIRRALFTSENWPGYNNIGPVNNVNRIFVPSNSGVTQGNVFSILQLGDDLDNNLERDWMHKGITMGAGNDIFWSGIIQDPDKNDSQPNESSESQNITSPS